MKPPYLLPPALALFLLGLAALGSWQLYRIGYYRGFQFRSRVAQIEQVIQAYQDAESQQRPNAPMMNFCAQAKQVRQWLAFLIEHEGPNSDGYWDPAVAYKLKQYDDLCAADRRDQGPLTGAR